MNKKQYCLLQLVKEIDAFCKKHDITYYCAAGTVLGAIRHGGFIPWDDDIDILMTRSEFLRFVSAFEKDGPEDRAISFYEADPDHHSTVARYIKEDSTMFCHYHILGYASAGILIDIFALDPIPDGLENQREHIAKFYAYSDLIAPTLCHSNRLPEEYEHIYDECLAEVKSKGVEAVAAELADKLFSYDEASCSNYMLRWGSQPFIYPKEFFGKPAYLAFEDMMIPVPSKWPQYLVSHYSFGWTDIPKADSRDNHVTIFDPDRDYHEVYVLRDREFDQDELLKLHRDLQAARRKADSIGHKLEIYAAEHQSKICMDEVRQRREVSGPDDSIVRIYEPYIKLQTSPKYMGGHMHGRQYHWLFPLIVPIGEDELKQLLWALINECRLTDCDKITGIYVRAGLDTDEIRRIRQVLDQISIAAGLYYSGDCSEAITYIRSIDGYEDIPPLKNYEWLAMAAEGLSPDQALELEQLASEKNSSPELKKAWADWLYSQGKTQDAEDAYRALMKTSRNGMFLRDIQKKGFSIEFGDTDAENSAADAEASDSPSASSGGIGSSFRRAARAVKRRLPGQQKREAQKKAFRAVMGDSEDFRSHKGLPWAEYGEARKEVASLDRRVRGAWQKLIALETKVHQDMDN